VKAPPAPVSSSYAYQSDKAQDGSYAYQSDKAQDGQSQTRRFLGLIWYLSAFGLVFPRFSIIFFLSIMARIPVAAKPKASPPPTLIIFFKLSMASLPFRSIRPPASYSVPALVILPIYINHWPKRVFCQLEMKHHSVIFGKYTFYQHHDRRIVGFGLDLCNFSKTPGESIFGVVF
jgi:hypothetical protein